MCGLTGYWSRRVGVGQGLEFLEKSCRILAHRGPDESAVLQRDRCGTGFVRLSILDLETGMQPLTDPDGTSIVCNGQIYNYVELRNELPAETYRTRGDMEVALNAYRHHGVMFPRKLNGMFAGAIHDPSAERVVLFRDRFGIKPLYYTVNDHGFFYSSEIRPLLEAPGTAREMDDEMLPVWFTYRYVPGERTLFKGIRKLLPGSILILDTGSGEFKTRFYWEWSFPAAEPVISLAEAEEEFTRLFRDSVRIRLRSDVEVGSLISGGIDSSAVASAAVLHKPDMKLFTIGFEEAAYDETREVDRFLHSMGQRFQGCEVVRETCLLNRLDLLPGIVRAVEEPISLGTMVPTDQVCRLASEKLKVVLTGEGADEIFAGYRKFLLEAAALEFPKADSQGKKELIRLYPEIRGYSGGSGADHVSRHIAGERLFGKEELEALLGASGYSDRISWDPRLGNIPSDLNPISAMQIIETLTRLPNYVNLRLDKLSMKHSLETRTPFLDYRLAEFSSSLPLELRVNLKAGMEKFICRESFRTSGILPPEVSRREKKPFTMPIADWFSDPSALPEPIAEILLGRETDSQGILNGDMVRKYARQVTGKGVGPSTLVSAGDRVFAIVVFSLWYGEFIKETA